MDNAIVRNHKVFSLEVITLNEYQERHGDLGSQEKLAKHFGVAQSTMNRWLHRKDLYVGLRKGGRWKVVFVETVLKEA